MLSTIMIVQWLYYVKKYLKCMDDEIKKSIQNWFLCECYFSNAWKKNVYQSYSLFNKNTHSRTCEGVGCLWRFSQQGREALNSLVETSFLEELTEVEQNKGTRSKLIHVARMFQRRLFWLSGLGDKF